MQFTTALYTMVAIWIATLWVTVSLAAQFVLGGLPAEVYQVDVVGEMLAKLWERVERCLHLKDLWLHAWASRWLGPSSRLPRGGHRVMQDEHWALQDSAARVQDMVLEGSNKISSLAASLSSAVDLIEGRVDAVVTNGVHWGAWLALTTALSHFPKLEHEFDLLAFKYNADLTGGGGVS
jgi:hypothetical protein